MKTYISKINKLPGTDFHEVNRQALSVYSKIKKKSKRRPYVRSQYFNKEKVFLELFWKHLFEKKNWGDRVRRLQYFPAALDLIQCSHFHPTSKINPNKKNEILHRFTGILTTNELFYVQIKEDVNTSRKWLISVFPEK